MSLDRLIEKIAALQNPTVAGLDTRLEYVPESIRAESFGKFGRTLEGAADAVLTFNRGVIDALCGIVPAVKPQCACYEMYGWQGMRALRGTIDYAKKKGMYVIVDGKRNDIGSTMRAYAAAYLGETDVGGERIAAFGADALTVNGYLGTDGIRPLLDVCAGFDKGIFVLAKTSNPSSDELQNQSFEGGETLYEAMGRFCAEWGGSLPGRHGYNGVGAVVGATWPKQLKELREMLPETFFLVPGYGTQGGTADDVAPAFDGNGLGAVVNASRTLLCAWKERGAPEADYAKAAAAEAVRMRDAIRARVGAIRL